MRTLESRSPHKERFLPFLRLDHIPNLPSNLIPNCIPQTLDRSRTVQHQRLLPTILPPRSSDRLAQGKKHRRAHEERRLANALAARNGPEVLPRDGLAVGVVLEHADVELARDIAESGDLVVAGPGGEERARLGVPEGLFEGEEALSLHEGAFDLPVVEAWVDGVAHVLMY